MEVGSFPNHILPPGLAHHLCCHWLLDFDTEKLENYKRSFLIPTSSSKYPSLQAYPSVALGVLWLPLFFPASLNNSPATFYTLL